MRKIALVILIFAVIGCAGLKLPPEAQHVISVNSTIGCEFIKDMYIVTPTEITPESLTYTLQWQTYNAGGDAYLIISQLKTLKIGGRASNGPGEELTTHFAIYKCEP